MLLNLNLEDLDSYSDHSFMLNQNTMIIRSNTHDNIRVIVITFMVALYPELYF